METDSGYRKVPVFSAGQVYAAVSPERALEAVRDAFVAYARGDWTMPPKVYVPAYPAGDFRAMPALGGGHALLKWVTSFPGNPAQGLPTVMGLVLLSDASNGALRAALDASAVTALRTGAAAVLAAETLGRSNANTAAVVGAGVNGIAAARTFVARGQDVALYDVDSDRAHSAAAQLGARTATREEAVAADLHGWTLRSANDAGSPTRSSSSRERALALRRSQPRSSGTVAMLAATVRWGNRPACWMT